MKFERRCRKFSLSYRLGPRGIYSLLRYKTAAKNWESFKQVYIDDGLFYAAMFYHC